MEFDSLFDLCASQLNDKKTKEKLENMLQPVKQYVKGSVKPFVIVCITLLVLILILQGYILFKLIQFRCALNSV